jgi:hypothetical protein
VPSDVAATLASHVATTRKNGLTVPTQSTSTGLCNCQTGKFLAEMFLGHLLQVNNDGLFFSHFI